MTTSWQPKASLAVLQQRAKIIREIRQFFYKRDFLEVETPIMSQHTVTDPYLMSLAILSNSQTLYLQTSPEYHMKRLLAAGSGPIFQLTKSFRDDEKGRLHNPEFTMLEWYQPGFGQHDLIDEMHQFLQEILRVDSVERMSYENLFLEHLHINPHSASVVELQICARQYEINDLDLGQDKDAWLQVLMSNVIEPRLGLSRPIIIFDFPASQAALAKIRDIDKPVAERFEVYFRGIELANGFHELTDVAEQRQRFLKNIAQRVQLGLPKIRLDNYFLGALEHGLPACAGVAVGIDRLIMLALDKASIAEVLTFTIENA